MRIPREVWWIAALTLLMFLIILLMTGGSSGREEARMSGGRTTYSTGPEGVRALYLALQELGYDVHRVRGPFLPRTLPKRGSLVAVEPAGVAGLEWQTLYDWVADGHALILASEDWPAGSAMAGALGCAGGACDPETGAKQTPLTRARAAQPTFLARNVRRLAVRSPERIPCPTTDRSTRLIAFRRDEGEGRSHSRARTMEDHLRAAMPMFRDHKGTVAAHASIGQGSVVLFGSPWSMSNEGIPKEDNLTFVLNALGPPARGPVYFDEYHHGYGRNLLWQITPLSMKLAAAQALLGLLIVMYARSRRFGRIIPLDRGTRQRSEFLGTMAGLLQKGHATGLGVRTAYDAALDRLRLELGLPRETEPAELARAARRINQEAGEKLARALQEARDALEMRSALSDARALAAVRALDEAVRSLRQV